MADWMDEITYEMLQPKQQEIADIIGVKHTLMLCEYAQGSGLYIPRNDRAFNKLRNRKMRKEYAEGNWSIAALAKKYHLTDVHIRNIVRDLAPDQVSLFSADDKG